MCKENWIPVSRTGMTL
ncbi:MAG: hypothetical protein LBP77_00240 [Rickettsiales bacterium]|nr:hypothetical protein [Rickettsiales bacterium]